MPLIGTVAYRPVTPQVGSQRQRPLIAADGGRVSDYVAHDIFGQAS
jgi:hypothetical protein